MKIELKPCPFCGHEPRSAYSKAHQIYVIWCANSECAARPNMEVANPLLWNVRPGEDALRRERDDMCGIPSPRSLHP